jgi:hypothetical protein
MKLNIDEVDFEFVCRVLCKARAAFENRMTDTSISESYRDHFRESAKMANTAHDIMIAAKHAGEAPKDEQHGGAPAPDGAERGANGDTK